MPSAVQSVNGFVSANYIKIVFVAVVGLLYENVLFVLCVSMCVCMCVCVLYVLKSFCY